MSLKIFVYLIKVMNKKQRKLRQKKLANQAFNDFLQILYSLNDNSEELEQIYVKELLKIQTSFNIKINRDTKLLFCKKCYTFHPIHNKTKNRTQIIRINPKTKTKDYICKNCGNKKRFKI